MWHKIIFLVLLVCCGCGNYVGWASDPETDLETYLFENDRTVYQELTDTDIINIMDEVMEKLDSSWPGEYGEHNNDCMDRLNRLKIIYIPNVNEACEGLSTRACIYTDKWKIFIGTEGRDKLSVYEDLSHEFTHFIGKCMYEDEDSDHSNEFYWKTLDKNNSIEARANKLIWEKTRL